MRDGAWTHQGGSRTQTTSARWGRKHWGAVPGAFLMLMPLAGSGCGAAHPPNLVVEPEVLDLGPATRGQILQGHFRLMNVGRQAVRITGFQAGCGCTDVSAFPEQIPPGGSTRVEIAVNTSMFGEGSVTETIRVSSNDRLHPTATLTVAAKVASEFQVSESLLDFDGDTANATAASQSLTIRVAQASDLAVLSVAPSEDFVKARLDRLSPSEYRITASIVRPESRGTHYAVLNVSTSSKFMPVIRVPVRVTIDP